MDGEFDPITDVMVELSRVGYQLLRDRDPVVLDGIHPDAEFHYPESLPTQAVVHGPWELLAAWETIGGLFEDPYAEPEEFLPSGDTLIVLGTWRGKARATGITVAVPFAHVQRFRDGKLAWFRFYTDSGTILQALDAGSTQPTR